jgi:ribose transport system ATP-binding protein
MAEVYELSERVSVLRDGTYVGTLPREEIKPESIVKMMVGRDLSSFYKKEHGGGSAGREVLKVRNLTDGGRVKNGSFTLHAGEVLGLAGLVGAGRTELARLIYGAEPHTGGSIEINGKPASFRNPREAIDAGIVYLTEDRKAQGLFLDMSVGENINLNVIQRDAKLGGWLDRGRARQRSLAAIKSLTIRVPGPDMPIGALSGGNQQKGLISRLLETEPKVLILDEPTRGVDVGAKSEIYRIIDELAKSGAAVLVISSELPEVVGIADRVVVMREGETVGEVGGTTGVKINEENIMALATGVDMGKAA